MKRLLLALPLFLLAATPVSAYKITYAEQWYQLYHLHLYQYPDDSMENIWYLEQALKAPFANPLYALAKINNKLQWERYKDLFAMHVNLLLIQQYRILGSKYDKQVAYFYNYPWKQENLDSLNTAEKLFKVAQEFWKVAVDWSNKASDLSIVQLPAIQYWEDESYRIQTGDLDYEAIIDGDLARLEHVRQVFEKMGPSTY
ncbi:MAG TPA: hypothetical protein VMV68_06525 [Spirochaetia bacterium]|nr:hypothetical protein [Spirochaetia bacterium]